MNIFSHTSENKKTPQLFISDKLNFSKIKRSDRNIKTNSNSRLLINICLRNIFQDKIVQFLLACRDMFLAPKHKIEWYKNNSEHASPCI